MLDDLIRQAIAGQRVVAYRYNGQRRIGEPHLYGRMKGHAAVLMYQTGGSSLSGPYPRWQRCNLDAITRFTITSRQFPCARLSADSGHADWDEVWAMVG